MSSTILELRQRDAPDSLDTPGDWETILAKPIVIEDGDQIAMKSCFLDTKAQSNDRIVIQNPIKVEISNGFYINMVRTAAQENDIIQNGNYVDNTAAGFVDGKPYVLVDVQDSNAGAFYFPGCSVQCSHDASGFMSTNDINNGTMTVQYVKPGAPPGNTSTYTFNLLDSGVYAPGITPPAKNGTVNIPGNNTFWHAVVYDPTRNLPGADVPMKIINGSILNSGSSGEKTSISISNDGQKLKLKRTFPSRLGTTEEQWEYDLFDVKNPATAAGNATVTPHIKSDPDLNYFIIPSGSYDPIQLCSIVNRQIQLNSVVTYGPNNTSYVNSNFLVAYNPDYPDFSGDGRVTKFLAQDLSNATQYTSASLGTDANGAILVGATQMVLDYDQAAKQFMWSYIHMPYDGGEDSSGLVESAGVLESQNLKNNNGQPFAVSRNGGIYFTDFIQREFIGNDVVISKGGNGRLSISGGTPRDFDFLHECCGFVTQDLITALKPTQATLPLTLGTFVINDLTMPEDLTAGVKTTTGYFGLDAIVDRADADKWWHPPAAGDDGFFSNITGMTIPIYNDEKSGGKDDHLTFGYFLIDINAKFNNEFTGAAYQSNDIRAIVSRYYEQNSYTIGSGGDSVAYIHRGDPVILSSFRCRILSSDKKIAPNLEDDNTIMVEVIKALPQIPEN